MSARLTMTACRPLIRSFLPFLFVLVCSGSFAQNQQTDGILEKLSKRPFDNTALGDVMKSQDPSLFRPALRKAFEETNERAVKQAIARTIVELGDPTPEYFDYLAQFALDAVRSPAPTIWLYDAEGRVVRGKVSPEFEEWCRGQGLDVLQEAEKQITVYPSDLFELAKTRDQQVFEIGNGFVLSFCLFIRHVIAVPCFNRRCACSTIADGLPRNEGRLREVVQGNGMAPKE